MLPPPSPPDIPSGGDMAWGLNRDADATMMYSFIVSRLNYCNSLFAGSSSYNMHKHRGVFNCAAHVVYGGRRSDHVTPILRDRLHWLRTRERIAYKLCVLVYNALNGSAPTYLSELCIPVALRLALRDQRRSVRATFRVTVRHACIFILWSDGVECPACRHMLIYNHNWI